MKQYLSKLLILIAVISLGIIIGAVIGKQVNAFKSESNLSDIRAYTKTVQNKMKGLKVGYTLHDDFLEDLSRNKIKLSDLIKKNTIICFFEPTCPSCINEFEETSGYFKNDRSDKIIMITSGNPREIEDLINKHSTEFKILYDHKKTYSAQYSIFSYPLNVIVDKDMKILEVLAGALTEHELNLVIDN